MFVQLTILVNVLQIWIYWDPVWLVDKKIIQDILGLNMVKNETKKY